MKKVMFALLLSTSFLSVSLAGGGEKVRVLSEETLSRKITFKVFAKPKKMLDVKIYGVQDTLASVSLVDQRGSSSYYEFIKNNKSVYSIDLSGLQPGIYFVKLNTNNEIRMKMIVVE
ncbi:MAG: T9SS type A sorting domain-containing protein [Brumimicrobium sp.]|nr:T9SS type A sorting domain-containing protein [Brumimicrobium sp.]